MKDSGIMFKFIALGVFALSSVFRADAATWSMLAVEVDSRHAADVVAAAEKLMSSKVGQEFPGKLLLQAVIANGSDPTTHVFVPIYKNAAEREAFVQKLQADAAWAEFQKATAGVSEPTSQVMYRTAKSWGDLAESDHVWMAHAFAVSDPAAFVSALETLMASETGKKFPGQVYLSQVVAGGMSPVTHVISVGYDSEAEMANWQTSTQSTADWQSYLDASRKAAQYLGATLARDVKWWGKATLKDLAGEN